MNPGKVTPSSTSGSEWKDFEKRLTDHVGNKVNVTYDSTSKKGTLTINFNSLDELDGIVKRNIGLKEYD